MTLFLSSFRNLAALLALTVSQGFRRECRTTYTTLVQDRAN
jgi:hypothetical protein